MATIGILVNGWPPFQMRNANSPAPSAFELSPQLAPPKSALRKSVVLFGLWFFLSAFICPGFERNGVKVEHWYIVRVDEPMGKHRLMFAWCWDGQTYWRHGAVKGAEKLRRYVNFVYKPNKTTHFPGSTMSLITLQFSPTFTINENGMPAFSSPGLQ